MSAPRFARLAKRLRDAVADAAWVQWHALGGQVAGRVPTSIVDPEALLLATISLADVEPRFRDLLGGFMSADTRRISVQRLRRLAESFPARVREGLGRFAQGAVDAGDPRWRRLASGKAMTVGRPGKVGSAVSRFGDPGSLMLRMRAAFGVDVRADVITYLIGNQGGPADIRAMRVELGYVTNSLRSACESLEEAGLMSSTSTRPAQYRLPWGRWQRFLELSVTPWHSWSAAYGLAMELHDWLRAHEGREPSVSTERILVREWSDAHAGQVVLLGIDPDATAPRTFESLGGSIAGTLERWA